MSSNDLSLIEKYEEETGKKAILKGKETKIYLKWKNEQQKIENNINKDSSSSLSNSMDSSLFLKIQKEIKQLSEKINSFDSRLSVIEEKLSNNNEMHFIKNISTDILLQTIKDIYNSSAKLIGDFVHLSTIIQKLKKNFYWSNEKIQKEIFQLFEDNKIQLFPGKTLDDVPFIKNGKSYAWFKITD